MNGKYIRITVVSGPDTGLTHDIYNNALIGRDSTLCNVVLDDPTISSRHARVELYPIPQVVDLKSANHTYLNNTIVKNAEIHSGDILQLGGTIIRIDIIDETEVLEVEKKRDMRKVHVTIVLALILTFGFIGYGLHKKELEQLATSKLDVKRLEGTINIAGIMTFRYPWIDHNNNLNDFTLYDPDARTRLFIPEWLRTDRASRPSTSQMLMTSRVLPPNPLSPSMEHRTPRRNWHERPPLLGSGRLIFGNENRHLIVLENYITIIYHYQSPKYSDPHGDLDFRIRLEIWDGLPKAEPISHFALNRPAKNSVGGPDLGYSAVPRAFRSNIPDRTWRIRSESRQEAHFTVGNVTRYWMLQVKEGEALYILTIWFQREHEQRLENALQAILDGQEFTGRERNYSDADMRELSILLESEADSLLPDLLRWRFDDFERYDRKSDFFHAFSLYHMALVYRQVIGDWPNHERVLPLQNKLIHLYNYIQDPNSVFNRLFFEIEDSIRSTQPQVSSIENNLRILSRIVETGTIMEGSYTLSTGNQVTVNFLPDDWLIYCYIRNQDLSILKDRL